MVNYWSADSELISENLQTSSMLTVQKSGVSKIFKCFRKKVFSLTKAANTVFD